MTRHTHDQIEDALGLRTQIDDLENILFICRPVLVTFLLYRAIRNNGVETRNVLDILHNDAEFLPKFLALCGDDDIEAISRCLETVALIGKISACIEIMRVWLTQNMITKALGLS